jgi:hypothetical protein
MLPLDVPNRQVRSRPDAAACIPLQSSTTHPSNQLLPSPVLVVGRVVHPVDGPPSSFSAMAVWLIAQRGAARCQCFSPDTNQTISPGRITLIGPHPSERPQASGDEQCLAQRMRVPRGPRTPLECDGRAAYTGVATTAERGVDPDRAGEMRLRSPSEGCEPLRMMSIVHLLASKPANARRI